jgi:hypothetical protein
MKSMTVILASAASAFCNYNGGGNMNAFEKGDAVYRETHMLGIDDYHAGLMGKFFINSAGKPALSFAHMHVQRFESWSGTVDGAAVTMTPTGTTGEGADDADCGILGSGGDFRVRKMELAIDPAVRHSAQTVGVLGKAFRSIWGYDAGMSGGTSSAACDGGSASGNGSPGSGDFIYRGAFNSITALATASVRDNIINEGFINLARAAYMVALEWTGTDLVNYFTEWDPWPYSYFRNLYDMTDSRCDFLTEWSYEKSGVPVWGADSRLKWINGGSTDNADYHNNFLNSNTGYTLDEYSALVESGDFTGNGRNSQRRTTFRPSLAQSPTVTFKETISGNTTVPRLEVTEHASTNVYYSIELMQKSNGQFVEYAKDADGNQYKYRQLYLSQDLGWGRSQVFYPSKHSSQNWNDYRVMVVVTDEGTNTAELYYLTLAEINPTPQPNITSLAFPIGYRTEDCFPGTEQKIYGTNFDPMASNNIIIMNGAILRAASKGSNWIGFTIPSTALPGDLKVEVNGKVSGTLYQDLETGIANVSSQEARVGDIVTITGNGFVTNVGYGTGGNSVSVSTGVTSVRTQVTEASPTRVSFIVPDGARHTIYMTFPAPGGRMVQQKEVRDFIVKPDIASFSPATAIRGGWITINGTGFNPNSVVRLDETALETSFIDGHTLRAKVPPAFALGEAYLIVFNHEQNTEDACGTVILESKSIPRVVQVRQISPAINMLLLQ